MQLFNIFAASKPCPGGNFLGLPKWYKYLPGQTDPTTHLCSPQLTSINDVWVIGAAIIELLLRIAALLAIVYIIYGAIQYITSQGDSAKANKARQAVSNALVGLVIAVLSAAVVNYIAGRFNS